MQSKAVTYLLALTVTFLYHSVAGELIITPRNTEAKVGETTYLNCSTNETEEIFWYHGEEYIYYGFGILEPYNGRFEIDKNASNGSHNLVIHSVKPSDAGEYICVDKDGLGARRSAELVVLGNEPDCHSDMQPDGIIGQNVFGIPPDEAQLTCNVSYHGNIPPMMEWNKVGGHSSVKDSVAYNVTSNNRFIYTLKIKGDFILDNSSYVCQTTRSTQNQYKCISETIKVLYFVDGDTKEQNVVRGDRIICIASNSTFPCTTQWYHDDYACPFPCAEAITAHLLGVYMCTVKCHIRGKDYYTEALKVFVTEATTSPSLSTSGTSAPAVVVSIVVVVVVIILSVASIVIFKVRKQRMKRAGEQRMERREIMHDNFEKVHLFETSILDGTSGKVAEEEVRLLHTIKGDVNSRDEIRGVTILNERLFVAPQHSSQLKVYHCNDFQTMNLIEVEGLVSAYDMCSCKTNNNYCLYILDQKADDTPTEVLRITTDGDVVANWLVDDNAEGSLSATAEGNVIITVSSKQRLLEYLPTGNLERVITLSDCADLLHAIKRDDRYIVSYGVVLEPLPRVCIVDKEGNVERSFIHQTGSIVNQLMMPLYLASGINGSVIVADFICNRVFILDSNLEFKTNIVPSKRQLFLNPMTVFVWETLLVVHVAAGVSCEATSEEVGQYRNEGSNSSPNNDFPIERDCKILVFDIRSLLKKYCS